MQRLQVRLPGSNGNRVLISRVTTPNTLHAEYTKPQRRKKHKEKKGRLKNVNKYMTEKVREDEENRKQI